MATVWRGDDNEAGTLSLSVEDDSSLARLRFFRKLSAEEIDALLAESSSHHVPKQHVVFCEGELLTHLYVVHTGSFKLVRHSEQGKELIVDLARSGDCFGALAEPQESVTLAQALEESSLVVLPLAAIRRAIVQNGSFAVSLLRMAERRHRRAETAAARLAFESVPERLAHVLIDESNTDSGTLTIPLNQTEIANLIGSSRETVCSILNQFRRRGLLEIDRGRIRIADRNGLASAR